jgi:AcrR family transcriptional regulator
MGSTANVFRNRDAIIEALLGEIEARDLRFFAEARTPADPDGLAGMLARGVVLQASPPHATVTRVRFELLLLRPERLRPGHERLVGVLEDQIAALGTQPSSARAISALLEGALLYAISSDDAGLDQAELTHSIRVLLEPE